MRQLRDCPARAAQRCARRVCARDHAPIARPASTAFVLSRVTLHVPLACVAARTWAARHTCKYLGKGCSKPLLRQAPSSQWQRLVDNESCEQLHEDGLMSTGDARMRCSTAHRDCEVFVRALKLMSPLRTAPAWRKQEPLPAPGPYSTYGSGSKSIVGTSFGPRSLQHGPFPLDTCFVAFSWLSLYPYEYAGDRVHLGVGLEWGALCDPPTGRPPGQRVQACQVQAVRVRQSP
jgi:hypothetical protein